MSVFVASIGLHFPKALIAPSRRDGGPEGPPRRVEGGFRLIWPGWGEGGCREQPDAAAISGQMKPDPFAA